MAPLAPPKSAHGLYNSLYYRTSRDQTLSHMQSHPALLSGTFVAELGCRFYS